MSNGVICFRIALNSFVLPIHKVSVGFAPLLGLCPDEYFLSDYMLFLSFSYFSPTLTNSDARLCYFGSYFLTILLFLILLILLLCLTHSLFHFLVLHIRLLLIYNLLPLLIVSFLMHSFLSLYNSYAVL